jgi:hypothetical protein
MASAAMGAACFRLVRWHFSQLVPPLQTLERERDYQSLGMRRPRKLWPLVAALGAAALWALGEGAFFFISQPRQRQLTFSSALEHTVAAKPARNVASTVDELCREVHWTSGKAAVHRDARIQRCVVSERSSYRPEDARRVDVRMCVDRSMLLLPDDPHFEDSRGLSVKPATEPDWVATRKVFIGGQEFDFRADMDVALLGAAFASALKTTPCFLGGLQPGDAHAGSAGDPYTQHSWRLMCSVEEALAAGAALRDVWLHQVDLRVAPFQTDQGFGRTILPKQQNQSGGQKRNDSHAGGDGLPAEIVIGTEDVAPLNLLSGAIIGVVGLICYCAVSMLPDRESAAVLLDLCHVQKSEGSHETDQRTDIEHN